MLKRWEDLPDFMKIDEVWPYWKILWDKRYQLGLKRIFDVIIALLLLIVLIIPMIVIAIWIKLDSKGPVFYRQERVTIYGKCFKIHKFRTMIENADQIGSTITSSNDYRITRSGTILRYYRLDELPQIFDILIGNMSFVGTRPEATKYVFSYKKEYYATFLMLAGITSEASIRYKDEDRLLFNKQNIDQVYVERILPAKMTWNLESIRRFCFLRDILTMFRTVFAILGKNYN